MFQLSILHIAHISYFNVPLLWDLQAMLAEIVHSDIAWKWRISSITCDIIWNGQSLLSHFLFGPCRLILLVDKKPAPMLSWPISFPFHGVSAGAFQIYDISLICNDIYRFWPLKSWNGVTFRMSNRVPLILNVISWPICVHKGDDPPRRWCSSCINVRYFCLKYSTLFSLFRPSRFIPE